MKPIQLKLRRELLTLSKLHQAHHLGSCLSCIDLLWELFDKNLKGSDRFILSKGHAAMALYIVMSEKGIIPKKELFETFGQNGSRFLAHPSSLHLPEVIWSTGALGQGLSVGAGMSRFFLDQKSIEKVFVLISGGELNCGSTWEAIGSASALKLNNLVLLIDNNELQGLGADDEILQLNRNLKAKFESFGWGFSETDGHHLESVQKILSLDSQKDCPRVLNFNTVKGKGIKSIEGKVSCHYQAATADLLSEFEKEYEKTLF